MIEAVTLQSSADQAEYSLVAKEHISGAYPAKYYIFKSLGDPCGLCRNFWGMRISRRHRSIRMWTASACAASMIRRWENTGMMNMKKDDEQ